MDWLGVALGLIGWWFLPKNQILGLSIFICGNLSWIYWSIGNQTWSVLVIQVCLIFLNLRAIKIYYAQHALQN